MGRVRALHMDWKKEKMLKQARLGAIWGNRPGPYLFISKYGYMYNHIIAHISLLQLKEINMIKDVANFIYLINL